MQTFFEENPNFRTAVEQLPLTRPQDVARVFIPGGDQIIGRGLERIVINQEEVQPVFDEVAQTLRDEAQPIVEAIAALG
jgi:sn-glycerol 3-phosphate transport system substrate-binding protein